MVVRHLIFIIIFVLIGVGVSIIALEAYPYLVNRVHQKMSSVTSVFSDKIGTIFWIKVETLDVFSAQNPINITITTSATLPELIGLHLIFLGAEQYFPGDYDLLAPDFWDKQYTQMEESLRRDYLILTKKQTTFSGRKENVVYNYGGEYNIGINVFMEGEGGKGHGFGDTSYILPKAIKLSSVDSLAQIHNSYLTTGLAWLASGLTLLAIGFGALLDLMLRLFF